MRTTKRFATCLNCIDGRVQIPVINWIEDKKFKTFCSDNWLMGFK